VEVFLQQKVKRAEIQLQVQVVLVVAAAVLLPMVQLLAQI
jgi:hypothetical protein